MSSVDLADMCEDARRGEVRQRKVQERTRFNLDFIGEGRTRRFMEAGCYVVVCLVCLQSVWLPEAGILATVFMQM